MHPKDMIGQITPPTAGKPGAAGNSVNGTDYGKHSEEGQTVSRKRSAVLHEMTRPDFQEWLEENDTPVGIIALGAIEQHGPHLPLGMDSLAAINVAKVVAEFPGTVTFREDTLVAVLMDTIESLAYHGVEKQLIVNAHGGNREIVAYVCRVASREFGIQVVSPGPRSGQDAEALKDFVQRMDVHSGPGETGLALHLFGELVDMSRVEGYEPRTHFPEEIQELLDPEREDLDVAVQVFGAYIRNSDDFTETGVWGFADPNDADPEAAGKQFEKRVEWLVRYIELWKTLPTMEEAFGCE